MSIQLRKAYKISCELTEKLTSGHDCLCKQGKFDINGSYGTIEEVANRTEESNLADFTRNLAALQLSQKLRDRVAEANNRPLAYADGMSINQLISKQVGLNRLLSFYPETILQHDLVALNNRAERTKQEYESHMAQTQTYRGVTPSTTVTVAGVSEEIAERLLSERLRLRGEVEAVVEKLAYSNISELVELTDEERKLLTEFRIPV